ncbi:esterase [Pseudoclavibacter chungangensis]|uniref:Esterase n=1 Tax=Pseudoclavibacter chungangensis TaxID=587635 RepID=A0A7J5BSJ6_9MICO|nr:esterase [Pseudoclavibacter chungangensis]KAB1657263.1 esterase [Pseudoclavibacter chungangensis]NYJ66293.1 S-formylglutathione hydrolase FrmB [Pseudoclavibacter chungangensis]
MDQLLHARLDVPVVVAVLVVVVVAITVLIVFRPLPGTDPRAHRRRLLLVGVVTAAAGLLTACVVWILVDGIDLLGVPVEVGARVGIVLGVALAVTGAIVLFGRRRGGTERWRRVLGGTLVVLALVAGAAAVNVAVGQVRTVAQLFPAQVADAATGLPARIASSVDPVAEAAWTPPADMPAAGSTVQLEIPGTASGFTARPAWIYLPPAALVASPPPLPVMVILAGQPGDPSDILQSGRFEQILDDFAAAHNGLAPIVVSPDQLGASDANPMCVDGPLGNAATYLDTDVPDWIDQHLNVAENRLAWAFGGFSEGATCTFQIGLADSARYGTDIAISAELVPSLGDPATTIAKGFGGDDAAYEAAKPLSVVAAHAPYKDTVLIQGVGQQDAVYSGYAATLEQGAKAAGIDASTIVSSGTSHDFNTVADVLQQALPTYAERSGLVSA